MGWALALLLAFLPPVSQMSSNFEGRTKLVTGRTGSSAVITCDLPVENTRYIHWYFHHEGKAPQRLLYCDTYQSKAVLDLGISPGKKDNYLILKGSWKLVLQNLIENDSGVYYCAAWDRHSGSDLPYTTLKSALWLLSCPSHFLPLNLLYSVQRETQLHSRSPPHITLPWPQLHLFPTPPQDLPEEQAAVSRPQLSSLPESKVPSALLGHGGGPLTLLPIQGHLGSSCETRYFAQQMGRVFILNHVSNHGPDMAG
uniref:Ig-like domain-containing protein n=1 Tax=Callithrix jacchus TaxID=9483 RepID=A0A8I4A2W2_CALJA|nr:uncharacterized protein LOC103794671 [Callithrix jacchus]